MGGGGGGTENLGGGGGGGVNMGGGTENLGGGGGGVNIGGGVLGGGATLSAIIGPVPARAIVTPHSHVRSSTDPRYFLYIQYYTQQILFLV